MCFSASASFAVGVALIGPGIYAVKRTESSGMLAFACTPLVLSFHQIAEGFLWLSLTNSDFASWYNPALYGYSFISQPFWPIWVPLIMWLIETDKRRKNVLYYFLLLGGATSLYIFYCLITYGVSAVAENGHIRYYLHFPNLNVLRLVKFVTIAVTPFLSTLRHAKLLASAMMASLILTYIFYTDYLISVWCFFGAILSLLVILVVISSSKRTVIH
jgi:hypothetical protein